RWTWRGELAGRPLDFAAGLAWDRQDQHRRGYENFVGDTLGVVGALRRDEQDDVYDFDQYAQGMWRFADDWSLTLGMRHSTVRFSSLDHYVTADNPDDSGNVAYGATTPVAGLLFRVSGNWHLYASWGNGFETPTFNELAYSPNGGSGLNFALQPARSHNGEFGSKWRFGNGGKLELALFQADTDDELATLSSSGGRTTYQNVGHARRRGAELGLDLPLAAQWQLHAAYTFLDARFLDAFNDVAAGARIPGVPRQLLDADVEWGGEQGWHAAMQVDAASAVNANDDGTLTAPGYAVIGLNAGYVLNRDRCKVAPFARIDNLFDRRYIGSVIVNQTSGGSFEPAPSRTLFVGINVTWRQD